MKQFESATEQQLLEMTSEQRTEYGKQLYQHADKLIETMDKSNQLFTRLNEITNQMLQFGKDIENSKFKELEMEQHQILKLFLSI